jgi:hypothetical protein
MRQIKPWSCCRQTFFSCGGDIVPAHILQKNPVTECTHVPGERNNEADRRFAAQTLSDK